MGINEDDRRRMIEEYLAQKGEATNGSTDERSDDQETEAGNQRPRENGA